MKSAAGQARDANDVPALHAIGQQLEMMQSRQARLLQEQHHERSLRARYVEIKIKQFFSNFQSVLPTIRLLVTRPRVRTEVIFSLVIATKGDI
jgi:hypothetical protein